MAALGSIMRMDRPTMAVVVPVPVMPLRVKAMNPMVAIVKYSIFAFYILHLVFE